MSIVSTAFRGQFDESEISHDSAGLLQRSGAATHPAIRFYDYYPPAPYSHLLTSYEELKSTSFAGLIQALSQITPPTLGFYQCLFQPVANNWHHNVETLLGLEYEIKLHNTFSLGRPFSQQAPSGDLHQMARDLEIKAHNDRPFFCAAARVGLMGPRGAIAEEDMSSMAAFMNLFQHGGRPLLRVSDQDYERLFSRQALPRMIQRGVVLRPGFLVNSRELVGLVHVFVPGLLETRRVPLEPLEPLPVRDTSLLLGTCIGTCQYAGVTQRVCIPAQVRQRSTHLIAGSDMGKSSVMLNMFLQDINSGKGAAFIDIHGDAVKRLCEIIPPALYDRCVYFDPGDPDWVPLWNPMAVPPGGCIYRRADDLVSSMRRVFTDWGDRLEHVLRNGLIGLLSLPNSSLLDLYSLVRQKTRESEELRLQIIQVLVDEPVKKFWQTDFLKDYRVSDLQSPKPKLSKLVSAGSVSKMLLQTESRIDFREIRDQGRILLVDLSRGGDAAEILGAFMLSLLLSTALSRSDLPEEQRRPYSLFADEAHRYVAADAIENLIVQARKFGLDLCLAHQYLSQFDLQQVDALSTAACTLVGRLDKRDSQYFAKDLQELVEPKEITRLRPYEMMARIGTEIVRVKTLPPPPRAAGGDGQRLMALSRQKYCKRVAEIDREIRRRSDRWYQPFTPLTGDLQEWPFTEEDLKYEEF